MKTMKIIIAILSLIIVGLLVKIEFFTIPGDKKETECTEVMDALTAITTRTSIRAYEDKAVEPEKVEVMLRAAMCAPSAGNKQPWRFVVLNERQTLDSIASLIHTAGMLRGAPLAVVVCGDMNATFPDEGLDYWVEDASAATENLLLAAHALGLGAVWCGIYPLGERVAILKGMLQLPKDIVPLNIVSIGYPAEQPEPKDKWKPENIHYEQWNRGEFD